MLEAFVYKKNPTNWSKLFIVTRCFFNMALLLAPYNDAMRLGMGYVPLSSATLDVRTEVHLPSFNSFTQQLCINDAVKSAGALTSVTERDLRPQYRFGTMTAADGGNVDISQDVSWTAKFVDRISEVTDSMNVSGTYTALHSLQLHFCGSGRLMTVVDI